MKTGRIAAWAAAVLSAAFLVLFIPSPEPGAPKPAGGKPFIWNEDALWESLEKSFLEARAAGCVSSEPRSRSLLREMERLVARIAANDLPPDSPLFVALERSLFDLAPLAAACPGELPDYARIAMAARDAVKDQSRGWDMASPDARDRLYRLIYGGRAAIEEAILQAPPGTVPALLRGRDEPSAAPSAELMGVRLHSGDILLSRGGAPTSALIARGSDYPGNFSHAALAHVDEKGNLSIIESHIERGVAVSSPEEYLADVKLRVMVLRLRADLPRLQADPMLPHRAAKDALAAARRGHTPYDFSMDLSDRAKLFCSEVVSAPYADAGVHLWMGMSSISSPGVAGWLSALGVRNFITQEPSDLEYDPQLSVAAEWRDPAALRKDRLDNAAIEVMLEGAEKGEPLDYPWYRLPLARAVKLYSSLLNLFGRVGPVPEGMDAAAALRVERLRKRHAAIVKGTEALAERFRERNGYSPPYWDLAALARQARAEAEGRGGEI